jgi:ribonucleoside-diphosphate reductase alpha chain
MAEMDAAILEADTTVTSAVTSAPAPVRKNKEAGAGPAVSMTEKSDAGSDALVATMSAEVLVKAIATPKEDDSKTINARRFTIQTDHSRDALLTLFGKDTLDDRYLLPGEKYQDLFARVADAYSDDQDHAQRIYDYISKLWFMPGAVERRHGSGPADQLLPQFGR